MEVSLLLELNKIIESQRETINKQLLLINKLVKERAEQENLINNLLQEREEK